MNQTVQRVTTQCPSARMGKPRRGQLFFGLSNYGTALIVGIFVALMCAGTSHAQAPAPAVVIVEAPAQVGVGEVITVRLRVQGDVNPAAFEAYLAYDSNVAEFAGFVPAPGQSQLIAPEVANGAVVGAYRCATGPCMARRQPQASAATTPDVLGTVEILPLAPGRLEIDLSHINVVDSAGQPIAIDLPQTTVTVQVGNGELTFAPGDAGWTWRTDAVAATIADATAVDVTQDGQIAHSDVMEVALNWTLAREAGAPCGSASSADLNGDGCVDIADVQAAATFAGSAQADAAATVQASGTITVNSSLDEYDANLNDGVCRSASDVCTLRAAIQQANAREGSDTIRFAIPGEGVRTIQLGERLPTIWDATGRTHIDGYSQPGAVPNSDPTISNAQIMIEIRGDGSEAFDGLAITSHGNRVEGLAFYNLRRSLWIYGTGAYENVIVGNFIGTNAAGNFAAPAVSELQAHGVHVEQGALRNQIGGVAPEDRNIISGNARHGVGFWHVGTDENVVYNNIVGLSPDGLHRIPNLQQGVDMNYGASFNIVGGVETGQRNVISGNGENGAEVTHGVETTKNIIRGNYIGTDVSGEAANADTSNGGLGISLHDRIRDNLVAENVIGNNRAGGIQVDDFGTCCIRDNRIEKNWIGVTPGGVDIANGVFGVRLLAPESTVGPGNYIAFNPVGIQVEGVASIGNTITRNSIYSNSGLGIDIAPIGQINLNDTDDADSRPNGMLNYPVLDGLSRQQVTGSACAACVVEIFITDHKNLTFGEGKTFVGSTTADDSGHFTATVENVDYGDFLTATATDIQGNTSEFSRNALVPNPENSGPVAAEDTATTTQGNAVLIDVLANDSDPEDDGLTVVDVGAAENGSATTDGAFITYTPAAEFIGVDSFAYTVSDAIGGSSVATVTVNVVAGDDLAPGVIVSPTGISLTLGGPPVSYTIKLKSAPSAPVNITLVAEAPLVADPMQIVFNAENWQTPQTVTLSIDGEAAMVARVIQTSTVRHSVKSADSAYDNMGAPEVTVDLVEQTMNGLYLPVIEGP